MRKKIIVLATVFFTVACSTTSYNIKKKYDNEIVNIKISGKMPRKEANRVIDYLFYSKKYIEDNFVLRSTFFLTNIDYWIEPPGSTGKKHTECKYKATYFDGYGGDFLCIGVYKNKLKALWAGSWAESLPSRLPGKGRPLYPL